MIARRRVGMGRLIVAEASLFAVFVVAYLSSSLAGVIMWVPGSLVFLLAAVGLAMEALSFRPSAALS
jgi:heme/copper-type cytochrome/quinol oxidase subunit 3